MRNILISFCFLLVISCTQPNRFEPMDSKHTGIVFNNALDDNDSMLIISNGAGVGIADLNRDNLQDIIFAGNKVATRIYLNQGDFRFKDISANFAGLNDKQWYSSVSIADVNSDGWPDVYLTSTVGNTGKERQNRLWINNGCKTGEVPTFTEKAEEYGIASTAPSVDAAFLDYDLDGDLDLYVLNSNLIQRSSAAYRPRIKDGTAQNTDMLYRNNGDGTYSDVSKEAGILWEGYGLGLAIGDVNRDGFPDVYVSNDYLTNDLLYMNQGDGTFQNEIGKLLSYQTRSSMGNDMADVNNDGFVDIYTLDMLPESFSKKRQTINGHSYRSYLMDNRLGYEHQYVRNMLHLGNGTLGNEFLPYSEIGQITGLHQTEWSWSSLFADYDNDGDKDLIVTNGYPRDMTDKDWLVQRSQLAAGGTSMQDIIHLLPRLKVCNMAFENKGELNFVKRKDWLPEIGSYSYGAAFVDLDNDGDLDHVSSNFNDEAFVLKNTSMENAGDNLYFLRLKLTGSPGNTMAIGAKIELWQKDSYQYAENYLSRGYASSVDPVIHFGLKYGVDVDSIKVTWPGNAATTIRNKVAVNQMLELDNTNADKKLVPSEATGTSKHLFTKRQEVLDYKHEQNDFVDFFMGQKIIPHKFSQIGPVMAKGDINGDGLEDLLVGASNKQPTKVFLQGLNGFEEAHFDGLTTMKEVSESGMAVLDYDNDGDKDVLVIAGGYETVQESRSPNYNFMAGNRRYDERIAKQFQHYVYENDGGAFTARKLPVDPFIASVIRPCDYNKDGTTDLFIGARVKRGSYPLSEASWLIKNNKGTFETDTELSFDLGMVTDAVWTDYDKDGWMDLLVTREFNSLVLLRNEKGEKLVPKQLASLENKHGFWSSVVAADLDGDGDDDYLVGNLGHNNQVKVSEEYPMNLYGFDFDNNGILDPFRTSFWEDEKGRMTEYFVNYLDELREQSPWFQTRFETYTAFSQANVDAVFGEKLKEKVEHYFYVNTTSSQILWNENGDFSWEELPAAVQVSPLTKMVVRDFNADGYPDVLAGGNDHSYEVAAGIFDANKGIVLLNAGKDNDGKHSFSVLQPAESGIFLPGMLGSLLCFEGNSPFIVSGINRSEARVFEITNKEH